MEFAYKKAYVNILLTSKKTRFIVESRYRILEHLKKSHNAGFNQSVHFVMPTNEKIIRSAKLQCSVVQTEKQQPADLTDDYYDAMEYDIDIIEKL
jgi:hypothetical protein